MYTFTPGSVIGKMKTISGKVTCSQAKEIPAGAVAVVVVNDNSLMDAPSKTLGKVEIKDPKTFPIEFKVEFDEQPVLSMAYGIFAIQVFINLGERPHLLHGHSVQHRRRRHEKDQGQSGRVLSSKWLDLTTTAIEIQDD